ncbi:hypothetical protein XENTR_v10008672 [Xenopus tropicalis]|uniref:Cadherin-like and PC-esterase domain containing 1 n=1 Tax=Xenopus tropicalis TaxID=8364 RepID=A0A6I8RG61_XENTR|nr:cadherin-like and PC-esterase domain-containing protein 1 isoform X2 [Xenopus tropicalis]KAE8615958.1 hypothetical protein XENTR_v10008672 [Xenopus tropicalis]
MGWRRRYCPSPAIIGLALAACVFYQSLILLWRRASWKFEEYASDIKPADLNETLNREDCVLAAIRLYKRLKEFGESIQRDLISRPTRRIFLYVHPSLGSEEHIVYKDILSPFGNIVLTEEIKDVKADVTKNQGLVNTEDIFIYIPPNNSSESDCRKEKELYQFKKVNILLEVQQLLCRKETICEMSGKFPEVKNLTVCSPQSDAASFRTRVVTPFSPSKFRRKAHNTSPVFKTLLSDHFQHQNLPVIRAYVLLTSSSPLRAFLHSVAIVQHHPYQQFVPIKLKVFYEKFFKWNPPLQAFITMKEAIGKFLLSFGGLSETFSLPVISRCKECFQLLTVDVRYESLLPVVFEVRDHFYFEGLHADNMKVKKQILKEAFTFILRNTSSSILQALEVLLELSFKKKDVCKANPILKDLRWEEISMLLSSTQQHVHVEAFELIYPFTSDKLETLRSKLHSMTDTKMKLNPDMHLLLSQLLKDFQLLMNKASHLYPTVSNAYQTAYQYEQSALSGSIHGLKGIKEKNCSHDDDDLPHIRYIFSNPQLVLVPAFSPTIKDYYVEVPFDMVMVEIGAEAAHCDCKVRLEEKEGQGTVAFALGLGINQITIYVTDKSELTPIVLRSYRISVHREERPSLPLFDHYIICGFVQDCGLIIHSGKPCGLYPLSSFPKAPQKKCDSGDAKGQWIVPCLSCADNRTCDWRAISWYPYKCQHPILIKPELQECMQERKILFIGDSTNRGIMYYLIERVNETLQEWQKSHAMKFYNINKGRTAISYSYYPQFWIEATKRPTFESTLEQLIERSRPIINSHKTVLVVGGVQWLNSNHMQIINNILERENLLDILVIIKSIGMGFHLPVHGIHSLSATQVKNLHDDNQLILNMAKLYGYEVVDTLSITMGRYKEFMQGKCGCHFHEVIKSSVSKQHYQKISLLKNYTFGGQIFPRLQRFPANEKSPYHVHGPVNQVYSEILLSRICATK